MAVPNEVKMLSRVDLYALIRAEPMAKVSVRFEEAFLWLKPAAARRKTRFHGMPRVDPAFTCAAAACDLVRLPLSRDRR